MVRAFFVVATATVVLFVSQGAQAKVKETEADWLKQPTQEQLFGVWPNEAMRNGINGKALIACTVTVQGALRDCSVVEESPAGMSFGVAAIALTPQFLMKPATRDGKPVESGIRMPINFTGLRETSVGTRLKGNPAAAMSRTVIPNVPWAEAPAYSDVAAAYPAKARASGLGGRTTLKCMFKAEGRLGGCSTLTEEPTGQGFAAAARTLIPLFLGPAEFSNGKSTYGAIAQVPFVFAPEMLDPDKRLVGTPKWAVLPTGDTMLAGYPPKALDAGVKSARVVMGCTAGAGGKLEACQITSEEPAGLGFAAAGMELSRSFRVEPWTADGLPIVGGRIRVPIRYQLPDEEPAAPAKP